MPIPRCPARARRIGLHDVRNGLSCPRSWSRAGYGKTCGPACREAWNLNGAGRLEAVSGAEGLRLAKCHAPHTILLDLTMPGRSGLKVLEELSRRKPTRDMPVVIANAYALVLLGDQPRGARSLARARCSPACPKHGSTLGSAMG